MVSPEAGPTPLRPIPDPDDQSGPFWEAAARHQLVVQRCASCGRFRHPPRPMCPACRSMEAAFEPVSGRAHLWSWVVAHPPVLPAFAERVPYNVGVVELEVGVRMIGQVVDCANEDLRAGMPVEVAFEDVEEGVSLPGWRPAR
jgi:uncharacterized OB-fold protein